MNTPFITKQQAQVKDVVCVSLNPCVSELQLTEPLCNWTAVQLNPSSTNFEVFSILKYTANFKMYLNVQ